ncbi:MAG: hypothetical protein AAB262_12275 [Elusimicrobiota bacterium]
MGQSRNIAVLALALTVLAPGLAQREASAVVVAGKIAPVGVGAQAGLGISGLTSSSRHETAALTPNLILVSALTSLALPVGAPTAAIRTAAASAAAPVAISPVARTAQTVPAAASTPESRRTEGLSALAVSVEKLAQAKDAGNSTPLGRLFDGAEPLRPAHAMVAAPSSQPRGSAAKPLPASAERRAAAPRNSRPLPQKASQQPAQDSSLWRLGLVGVMSALGSIPLMIGLDGATQVITQGQADTLLNIGVALFGAALAITLSMFRTPARNLRRENGTAGFLIFLSTMAGFASSFAIVDFVLSGAVAGTGALLGLFLGLAGVLYAGVAYMSRSSRPVSRLTPLLVLAGYAGAVGTMVLLKSAVGALIGLGIMAATAASVYLLPAALAWVSAMISLAWEWAKRTSPQKPSMGIPAWLPKAVLWTGVALSVLGLALALILPASSLGPWMGLLAIAAPAGVLGKVLLERRRSGQPRMRNA